MPWKGLVTALPTPFRDGALDIAALAALLKYQHEHDVRSVCICGSTGEAYSLSEEERRQIISTVMQTMGDRLKVMVGVGSNDTSVAVRFTKMAKDLGAHCAMAVIPYYNRPTTDGLLAHFKAIAAVGLPVIIYNVPSRTGLDVDDEFIFSLLELENVIGIKDATGKVNRISNLLNIASRADGHVKIMSGDDETMLAARAVGACGLVSVVSNIIPATCVKIQKLCDDNDYLAASNLYKGIYPLIKALSCVTNPIPVKTAMSIIGLSSDELRLPLCATNAVNRENIRLAIRHCAELEPALRGFF